MIGNWCDQLSEECNSLSVYRDRGLDIGQLPLHSWGLLWAQDHEDLHCQISGLAISQMISTGQFQTGCLRRSQDVIGLRLLEAAPGNGPYFTSAKDWLELVMGLQIVRYSGDICSTDEHCGTTPCAWSVQGSLAASLFLFERVGEANTARSGACGWAGASKQR